ncbi:MAG: permease [Desulfobacter sp.]|nr:MAG: permease [Desulfobacter sp.]
MFTLALYGAAAVCLVLSFRKSKTKTRMALKKAWKSLENILPQFLCIIVLMGISLAFLDESTISRLLGESSGILGMGIAAVVGSIVFIPAFVAYPLAASLLAAGAGYMQITMFITALMMVGIITIPMEIDYFGKGIAIRRTMLAFGHSVVCAIVMGVLM